MHSHCYTSNQQDTNKISCNTLNQNRHTFFHSRGIQPKLTINQPNDIYEREANAVAENVVQRPTHYNRQAFFLPKPLPVTPMQRKCMHCEEEDTNVQMKEESFADGGMVAPASVHNVINTGGQPLEAG